MTEKETLVERYRRLKAEGEKMVETARQRLVEISKEKADLEILIDEVGGKRTHRVCIGEVRKRRREVLARIITSFGPGVPFARLECLEMLRKSGYETGNDENCLDNCLLDLRNAGRIRRIAPGRYILPPEKTQHPASPAPQPGEAPLTKLMEDEQ
jgi:hypothetical protein